MLFKGLYTHNTIIYPTLTFFEGHLFGENANIVDTQRESILYFSTQTHSFMVITPWTDKNVALGLVLPKKHQYIDNTH